MSKKTVYRRFAIPIGVKAKKQVIEIFKTKPGLVSLGIDTGSVHGHSKMVYTATKGNASMFVVVKDHGSEKHITAAEVEDVFKVANKLSKETETMIGCILVDNAARTVAKVVAVMFETKYGYKVLILR